MTQDSGALNIQVLEPAHIENEDKPTRPRRALTVACWLMLGMLAGFGFAFTKEQFDRYLRSAEDLEVSLSISVLGVVPRILGGSVTDKGQSLHLQPTSLVAEAFRTIRTALCFAKGGETAKTILFTSPEPGDGKSMTASNVAIALAQAGHRTLLIDADLRKPTQHDIFKFDKTSGLSRVMARQQKLREAIQHTAVPDLDLLACGPLPSNPSEILNGRRFAKMMVALSRTYDKIVIDSPPVGAVSDARILAASADLTVLVVRCGKSSRKASMLSMNGLTGVGANLVGAILNDVTEDAEQYGYGSYGLEGRSSRTALLPAASAEANGNGNGMNGGLNGKSNGFHHDLPREEEAPVLARRD